MRTTSEKPVFRCTASAASWESPWDSIRRGSPIDIDNKIVLLSKEHAKYTVFWNKG